LAPSSSEGEEVRVYVGLGSNIGRRERELTRAIERLRGLPDTRVVKVSRFVETKPVGVLDQPDFINSVVELDTSLGPLALLDRLKAIEGEMGRKPSTRWGPRLIDLDILLYGGRVVDLPNLKIPHPEIENRHFVLEGLLEIEPRLVNPRTGKPLAGALEALNHG